MFRVLGYKFAAPIYLSNVMSNTFLSSRLAQQLQFVMEIDKPKQVLQQNLWADGLQQENSAEHSWLGIWQLAFGIWHLAFGNIDIVASGICSSAVNMQRALTTLRN